MGSIVPNAHRVGRDVRGWRIAGPMGRGYTSADSNDVWIATYRWWNQIHS